MRKSPPFLFVFEESRWCRVSLNAAREVDAAEDEGSFEDDEDRNRPSRIDDGQRRAQVMGLSFEMEI